MADTTNGSAQVSNNFEIPTNLAVVISPTSDALTCFTGRQFSGKLQAYLATYVLSITSYYSLYSGYNGSPYWK